MRYQKQNKLVPDGIARPALLAATQGKLIIDKSKFQLRAYRDGKLDAARSRSRSASRAYPSPTGTFVVTEKLKNPTWIPPNSPWAKGLEPIPPGSGNPLGTRWIGTSAPAVGIHGTPQAYTIGTAASHGCIRMHIPDVEKLFNYVDVGESVEFRTERTAQPPVPGAAAPPSAPQVVPAREPRVRAGATEADAAGPAMTRPIARQRHRRRGERRRGERDQQLVVLAAGGRERARRPAGGRRHRRHARLQRQRVQVDLDGDAARLGQPAGVGRDAVGDVEHRVHEARQRPALGEPRPRPAVALRPASACSGGGATAPSSTSRPASEPPSAPVTARHVARPRPRARRRRGRPPEHRDGQHQHRRPASRRRRRPGSRRPRRTRRRRS